MKRSWPARLLTLAPREWEYRVVRLRNLVHCILTSKGDRTRRVLFVIGHPRTATRTLHQIFLENGVKSCHRSGRWPLASFDAFSDRGNFQPFRLLDRWYDDALFILNVRPAVHYLRSIARYWYDRRVSDHDPVRGRLTARCAVGELLRRHRHFVDVVRHFRGRDDLLIVDIEEPGAFDFVCDRAGLTNPGGIWRNRSSSDPPEGVERVIERAFDELGIADERRNPFAFRALLQGGEREAVGRFLDRRHECVHLSDRWLAHIRGERPIGVAG